MATLHVNMFGIVTKDIDIIKDENGNIFCCVFSMIVKDNGKPIPFSVYTTNYCLVKQCENKLTPGCSVLVDGVIEICFDKIKVSDKMSIPIITSNMTIITDDICFICTNQNKAYYINSRSIPIESAKPVSDIHFACNLDEELPF